MKIERVVYEGARVPEGNIPPYPNCEKETLEVVANMLASGAQARFEGATGREIMPEGVRWQVQGGLGIMTKI